MLAQNTLVKFTVNGKVLFGKVVGVASNNPHFDFLYIIEPFKPLESYEYSHFTMFGSWLTVVDTSESCINVDHIRIYRQNNPDQDLNPDPNVQYYEIDACNSLVGGMYSDECWTVYNGKLIDKETAIKIVPEFCEEIGRPDLADKIKILE